MPRSKSRSSSSSSRNRHSHTHTGKKHLRGGGPKEQRMYEDIKRSAERSGRYGGRAKEVAARTVMKYHSRHGHSPQE